MRDARKYGSAFQPRFRASVSSDSTRRTSSASFCGRGDETTWLNAFRKWPASVSGNFIGSSGVGGYTSPREAFPALIVFRNVPGGGGVPFQRRKCSFAPAGHYWTLQFAKVLGGKAGGALTFSPTLCSVPCLQKRKITRTCQQVRFGYYPPRWNPAPSQELLVIRRNRRTGEVSVDPLRWGLIPYWCVDAAAGGRKPINAKCETVRELPTFRDAYRKRRCIVPVDGFFEWKAIKSSEGAW
jgi:hypothetical protein